MNITVVGAGYVGLVTGACLADKGHKVTCVDKKIDVIGKIADGISPIYEKGLNELLKKVVCTKNLSTTSDINKAIRKSKLAIIAVGTPFKYEEIDLTYIKQVSEEIGLSFKRNNGYKVVAIKSTVIPTTTSSVLLPILEKTSGKKCGKDFGLCVNPEFLREGSAVEDFMNPDRIIIGCYDKKSGDILEDIYRPFGAKIFRVSLNTAEFTKYLSNTLLSTLISYSNEMSLVAYSIGDIDIKKSFELLHLDKRWFGNPAEMTSYVYPGCGFGGYCLPKDTAAIYTQAANAGYSPNILKSVMDMNVKIKEHIVNRIEASVDKNNSIGILGLSFKPNSDDVRETPARDIIKGLLERGYTKILAYDPIGIENFKKEYNFPIEYSYSLEDIFNKADYFLILTAWDEFKNNKDLCSKNVFDFRYIL